MEEAIEYALKVKVPSYLFDPHSCLSAVMGQHLSNERYGFMNPFSPVAMYNQHIPMPDLKTKVSLFDLIDSRTENLIELCRKENKLPLIAYSGGVDSIVILLAFMKAGYPFALALGEKSIEDSPEIFSYFYHLLSKSTKFFHLSQNHFEDDVRAIDKEKYLYITGHGGNVVGEIGMTGVGKRMDTTLALAPWEDAFRQLAMDANILTEKELYKLEPTIETVNHWASLFGFSKMRIYQIDSLIGVTQKNEFLMMQTELQDWITDGCIPFFWDERFYSWYFQNAHQYLGECLSHNYFKCYPKLYKPHLKKYIIENSSIDPNLIHGLAKTISYSEGSHWIDTSHLQYKTNKGYYTVNNIDKLVPRFLYLYKHYPNKEYVDYFGGLDLMLNKYGDIYELL